MNHTPGPWLIYRQPSGEIEKLDYLVKDGGSYEIDAHGLKHQWVAHALKIEDAHLIAAAPDLLAALEDMIEVLHELATPSMISGSPKVQAARAVIEKAKGKS